MGDVKTRIEVTSCHDCPFLVDAEVGGSVCTATSMGKQPFRPHDKLPPKWCPIRQGSVLVGQWARRSKSLREAEETTLDGRRLCVMTNHELESLEAMGEAAALVLSTRTRRFKKEPAHD